MRIDTETHFWLPQFLDYLEGRTTAPSLERLENGGFRMDSNASHTFIAAIPPQILELQLDLGDGRIKKMDENGVDMSLLSLTIPGTEQLEADESLAQAKAANDA